MRSTLDRQGQQVSQGQAGQITQIGHASLRQSIQNLQKPLSVPLESQQGRSPSPTQVPMTQSIQASQRQSRLFLTDQIIHQASGSNEHRSISYGSVDSKGKRPSVTFTYQSNIQPGLPPSPPKPLVPVIVPQINPVQVITEHTHTVV